MSARWSAEAGRLLGARPPRPGLQPASTPRSSVVSRSFLVQADCRPGWVRKRTWPHGAGGAGRGCFSTFYRDHHVAREYRAVEVRP